MKLYHSTINGDHYEAPLTLGIFTTPEAAIAAVEASIELHSCNICETQFPDDSVPDRTLNTSAWHWFGDDACDDPLWFAVTPCELNNDYGL